MLTNKQIVQRQCLRRERQPNANRRSALLAIALRDADALLGEALPAGGGDAALAGGWRSADDEVRLDLRPDGSYRLAVAGRRRPATGTYRVSGTAVQLCDTSGLRTAGSLGDGVLELAGHELLRTRVTC